MFEYLIQLTSAIAIAIVATLLGLIRGWLSELLVSNPRFAESWLGRLISTIVPKSKGAATGEAFAKKLTRLTSALSRTSAEVDVTLSEISAVAEQRQKAIQQLETEMNNLSVKEREAKERIAALERISLPAVEHFVKLSAPGEQRSAWRDYILFLAGVVVSTLISIVLKLAGSVDAPNVTWFCSASTSDLFRQIV